MDPWFKIACAIVAACVLDRVFTGMARRGWIYWRGQPALAGPPPIAVSLELPAASVPSPAHAALQECRDCGRRVSPAALACPSCGRVLRPSWLVVGGIVVACLAAFLARILERL